MALYRWLLNNYANSGDRILSTHGGSASDVIACLELGFDFLWFEIDPTFYKKAVERVEAFQAQQRFY